MRTLKGSFVGLCLLLIAIAKATPTSPLASASALADQITDGINQFASSLFESKVQSLSDNLLLSPLSTAIDLAMAASGSGGDTKSQLKKALNLPSFDNQTTQGYQALIDHLNDVQYNQVRLANKIFVGQNFSVKPTYSDMIKTSFRSEAENLDFKERVEAAKSINKWIQNVANNASSVIVNSSDLDDNKGLALVSAMYIKSEWNFKFDRADSRPRLFMTSKTDSKMVETMFRPGSYKFGNVPGNKGRFIVLPFKENELSMVIMLPNKVDGLADLAKDIQNNKIQDILKEGMDDLVQLRLPRFTLRSKVTLEDSLKSLGLTDMFENKADFHGITDGPLMFNKVVQATYIEVDEDGANIGNTDVNVIKRFINIIGIPKQFNVDHPFYFAIVRNITSSGNNSIVTLYSGQILEPKI
ncbi:antitrypsin-like isoform X1 [Megachile rotundata]|uniref:antitrypsin-like isoform X1 n=2 Tax=Megachile rotundata TaxID=143995 RepID=UPI003FD510A7